MGSGNRGGRAPPAPMFGFSRTVRDPLADAKSAERWFAAQPAGDPLATHAELISALGAIADRGYARSPTSLEAVFRADALAQPIREALTTQYIEHASRSSRIEHQPWSAMFDLSQAFLLAPRRSRATSPSMPGAASRSCPRSSSGRSCTWGLEAKIRPLPLRAVDPGEVGGAPRALLARLLAQDRAARR